LFKCPLLSSGNEELLGIQRVGGIAKGFKGIPGSGSSVANYPYATQK